MPAFPSAERLAALVSNVTQTMLGISFCADHGPVGPTLTWRTAVLPIAGARPITVGLSSDENGCVALSGALFSVERAKVDGGMIDDSLCELLNMTAGLVKGALALDQALGLPRIVQGETGNLDDAHAVVLRAQGLGLVLWIRDDA